ncbi:SlyX family protein [Parasphaerochaeta coccoides]|uniref:SlyX family protein n=1 Tax=Parasphaerochaeta coccoides (strain ATCC BAA-1237 / DSM 17374 / SPN1) TaxID=760011 RepID=F4GLV7_PARC1|nr:SlyX family protein [Parasphaerochaeta coccoides]AEC02998.1 SlyX family protein [Parasphaerochaeta coccoides DSM 17374]
MEQDERFTALETKISYLEDTVRTLDAIVRGHHDELEILKKEVKFLSGKVSDLMEIEGSSRPERKPPHY